MNKARKTTLATGEPAWTRRATGYVTATMVRHHGSYPAARDWLDRQAQRLSTRGMD